MQKPSEAPLVMVAQSLTRGTDGLILCALFTYALTSYIFLNIYSVNTSGKENRRWLLHVRNGLSAFHTSVLKAILKFKPGKNRILMIKYMA